METLEPSVVSVNEPFDIVAGDGGRVVTLVRPGRTPLLTVPPDAPSRRKEY